jgi:hypothetical protein
MPKPLTGKPVGHPPHKPDDESRLRVLRAAAFGITQEGISGLLGITPKTLEKYYRHELSRACDVLIEDIAGAMYIEAKAGSIPAQKYILGCRAGWKDVAVTEITGKDGAPLSILQILKADDAFEPD